MQRLPTEILTMVFKEAIRGSTSGDHYELLSQLLLVCRRWCDTLLWNTSVWSNIIVSGGATVSQALKSLNRSGSSNLTVDLVWSCPTDVIHVLLEELTRCSHRLASFKLTARLFPPLPKWASAAPNLHTLVLRNTGNPQSLKDFTCKPFSQLHTLVLEGFHSWPEECFGNLHNITLHIPPHHGTVSSAALLNLLAASPELRKFNISGCKQVLPPPPGTTAAILPHLALLTIRTSSARDILRHMSLPRTVEIRLTKCLDTIGYLRGASLSHPGDLSAPHTLAIGLDLVQSLVIFRAFARGKTDPSITIAEGLRSTSKAVVTKTLEEYTILPAFASVKALVVTAKISPHVPWGSWLLNFPALRYITVQS